MGPLDSYIFYKSALRDYLEKGMKEEERLNWMDIARQYEIKSKRTGKVVQNGNQDVQKFAKEMGFEVDTQARICRAKWKLPRLQHFIHPS